MHYGRETVGLAGIVAGSNLTEVEKYIRMKNPTQKQAAERLDVTQSGISDLMRGKIGLFSVDMLISMLAHAELKVDVQVRRSAA